MENGRSKNSVLSPTTNDVKYGFIIDNRKCIGCHACTVACKSEHEVPVGVNRTYVKQVEKGTFPESKRLFSVMRCNHCTNAPCVSICPTEALFIREDGIVDFDNDRCIGCKSCMQACPYDALYIDPETNTAAKCNYCAHRVDIGLEPACVIVCPEEAIVSGNMNDPKSEIAVLLSKHDVKVRKKEKDTIPNLFYINAQDESLVPSKSEPSDQYIWNSQSTGVGHFSKFAESLTKGKSLLEMTEQLDPKLFSADKITAKKERKTSVEVLMEKSKRVFDTPDKGILWGWEVSSYVWTKAISTGSFLIAFLSLFSNFSFKGDYLGQLALNFSDATTTLYIGISAGLFFLTITGILLIMDLDQPKRFLFILLRPHWKSWLVKGGYSITIFGICLSLSGLLIFMDVSLKYQFIVLSITSVFAIITSIYTAFLFRQAKGRDLWQSPLSAFHMLVHSLMGGSSLFILLSFFLNFQTTFLYFSQLTFVVSIILNLIIIFSEFKILNHSSDSKKALRLISNGRYSQVFWLVAIILGNLMPIGLIFSGLPLFTAISSALCFIGIFATQHLWVEAPQRIPLT